MQIQLSWYVSALEDSISILSHDWHLSRSNPTQATRKSHTTQSTPQKYCSDRCRREKPRPGPSIENDIEQSFTRLLGGGEERKIVKCEDVQRAVFTKTGTDDGASGDEVDLLGAGRQEEGDHSDSGEEAEDNDDDGGGVRLPSNMEPAAYSTSIKPESKDRRHKTLREWGMQKAREREMVRRAARRGVAFGFEMEEGKRKRVEAVQRGRVVESSFAKGEWGVRWRE